EELPNDPEVVSCTKIGSIDHVQEHDGPFSVLVAGPSLGTRAGLRRLAAIHREQPGTAIVVAFQNEPDASLREIVQVGAIDMVDYPVADVVRHEDEDVDLTTHIEDYLVQYEDKFWALPAPKEPSQADRITPTEVTKILDVLRTHYDYLVVDTPTALAETVLAAFDLSEHLFVMATLDLPSVRNLGLFLQTLQKLRISSDNVSLIMNKVEKDVGIDVEQITKLFPQGFRSTLPYAKEVSRSVNLGKPILAAQPDADIAKRIASGLTEFLPPDARRRLEESPAASGIKIGSLSRLFKRRMVHITESAR